MPDLESTIQKNNQKKTMSQINDAQLKMIVALCTWCAANKMFSTLTVFTSNLLPLFSRTCSCQVPVCVRVCFCLFFYFIYLFIFAFAWRYLWWVPEPAWPSVKWWKIYTWTIAILLPLPHLIAFSCSNFFDFETSPVILLSTSWNWIFFSWFISRLKN